MIYPRRETETNNKCGLDTVTLLLLCTTFVYLLALIFILYKSI